ncbi:uncharacterized protein N7443_009498 [Penicillium atrosanguineum]|uniref:uncharacterized protein n=1 Tax=Penicillium atrosanguineum TaxID=1132637 RepID=UPI002395BBB6|nr:uncharacterized protein N7443_009498 [Penicillium atrosanguineum]KAJ5289245.1 hypothetical protein N7443_009498 [Penicillium atrosanguineum]
MAFHRLLGNLLLLAVLATGFPHHFTGVNRTIDTTELKTWWHSTGEYNYKSPLASDSNVRQSHVYSVQVATAEGHHLPDGFYDSFVYESIPRNGNGKISIPGNYSSFYSDTSISGDGVTIEAGANITMAWTQFLYASDTVLRITRLDGRNPGNVIIRPTNLGYSMQNIEGATYVKVPFNTRGTRFSIEFEDDLFTYRNLKGGPECSEVENPPADCAYAQDFDPSYRNYVLEYNNTMPIVGVEPRNALLIFASPFPTSDLVPSASSGSTLEMKPGLITGLDKINQSVVYFKPGVYWMTGTAHARLPESVSWVYFAPGSYVKGAIEFTTNSTIIKATGFGVLSGEQYVYQANMLANYTNLNDNSNNVRMWRGWSTPYKSQEFILNGVTIAAPPYNSMDFYGDLTSIRLHAWDYKQVGAFFVQTDGLEMYPGSYVHDVFYHSGDDVIKTWCSDVTAERITVWKTTDAPIVQFGWWYENKTNIVVNDVDVIHSRVFRNELNGKAGRGVFGSTTFASDSMNDVWGNTSDSTLGTSLMSLSNFRCEGIHPGLFRIDPLMNYDNVLMENIWIEELSPNSTGLNLGFLHKFTDGSRGNIPAYFGKHSFNGIGLRIRNYTIGNERISFTADNWDGNSAGGIWVDPFYDGAWIIE